MEYLILIFGCLLSQWYSNLLLFDGVATHVWSSVPTTLDDCSFMNTFSVLSSTIKHIEDKLYKRSLSRSVEQSWHTRRSELRSLGPEWVVWRVQSTWKLPELKLWFMSGHLSQAVIGKFSVLWDVRSKADTDYPGLTMNGNHLIPVTLLSVLPKPISFPNSEMTALAQRMGR